MDTNSDQQLVSQSIAYSGPLPPAAEFERYEHAQSGTAERLLVLAEKESEHRRENENKLVDSKVKITLGSLGGIFASIFLGKPLGAIAPAIVALTSLAAVFIKK